ncbi:unnamed protein product [Rotaria sp. Silwood1]|nr:unnamed protein product [Rotaria sp. Silwood1]CAF1322168.1 unnamed protein product [Rotaria sp. Silwood1]CAF3459146.1 unnamed protein product [Rotaria sp. Silwood1]CAF5075212.1 unnamed protein product [Rotaria sp. Silwood1]
MVWFEVSKNGLISPMIFQPGKILLHKNYFGVVLPHAQAEGQRLLDGDSIYLWDEKRTGICCVPIDNLIRSVENWSHRIMPMLKIKHAYKE